MFTAHLVAAALLALVHVLSPQLDLGRVRHRRRWLSLAAGVSVAYAFVDLLPLMSEKQRAFMEAAAGQSLLAPEFRVYVAALLGFVVFYGLEHLMGQRPTVAEVLAESQREAPGATMVPLHLGGFATYNVLTGYLLVEWSREFVGLALYCVALGLHFLITDDSLLRDYGTRFGEVGRWVMAAAVLGGAALAWCVPVSPGWLAIIVGLVAGGVVINSVKDELPRTGEGRFGFFLIGALGYAMMILLAARLEAGR